jgi:hypothetical protein
MTKTLVVRCWKCKGKLIYRQISDLEIEVYHTCDIYCGTSDEHLKLHAIRSDKCPDCASETGKRGYITIPPKNIGSVATFGREVLCTNRWHDV